MEEATNWLTNEKVYVGDVSLPWDLKEETPQPRGSCVCLFWQKFKGSFFEVPFNEERKPIIHEK